MATASIADQVDEFNTGFAAAIGPDLSRVFDDEQVALRDAGVPADAVTLGTVVPDAQLLQPDGSSIALSALLEGRVGVLVFYRGAWCPYCNIALRTYQNELIPLINPARVQVVAISPQTPEKSQETVDGFELSFPVLSDPANALVRELGIRTEPSADARRAHTALGFDVADSNADATGDIPFPTVLIIDENRVVRFADVHVDYTTRTEVGVILEALESIG